MADFTSALKTHRLITSIIGIACLGILVGAALGWTGRPKDSAQRADEVSISSTTIAIRIINVERSKLGNASVLLVQLQNASDKDIKAITISNGDTWVTKNYLLGEEALQPAATVVQMIPLSTESAKDFKVTFEPAKEFKVVAVLFDNGTGDGEERFTRMLSDKREGMRAQASRLLPSIRRLSKSSSYQEQALSECEAEVLRLSTKPTDSRSVDYQDGMENVQQAFLKTLKDIKEESRANQFVSATSKRDKLTRVLQHLSAP